ncbi:MAG: TonB-dependent receptor, partial [Bacteroidales bacterium]|nr:TonB-dependent receptor [Bacteroidales bacterium]
RADFNYFSEAGKTSFGISTSYSAIQSNVLGKSFGDTIKSRIISDGFYTKSDKRTISNLYLEHVFEWSNWRIAGGILLSKPYYANQKAFLLPGIDLRYDFSSQLAIYSSFNMSSRLPTFTDLYYQGPTNLGNLELTPEKSYQAETGIKFKHKKFNSTATLFYIQGINTIDWVRPSDTVKWQPQNMGKTSTIGMEFISRYQFSKNKLINEISLDFLWQYSEKTAENLQLLYSDDFIRQKIGLNAQHNITQNLLLSWNVRYINRNGIFYLYNSQTKTETPNLFGEHFEADLKLSYRIKEWNIYLLINNLTNSRYFDISNIPAPGIWFMAGFSTRLNAK